MDHHPGVMFVSQYLNNMYVSFPSWFNNTVTNRLSTGHHTDVMEPSPVAGL